MRAAHSALLLLSALALASGVVFVTPSQVARACTGPGCWPGRFVPFAGSVPENLPAIHWGAGWQWDHPDGGGGTSERAFTQADELRFRCTDGSGKARDVAFHVEADGDAQLIVPDAKLEAGETCVIDSTGPACDASFGDPMLAEIVTGRAELEVSASAPLPSVFGTLRVETARTHSIWPGSDECEAIDVCGVKVAAELDPGTAPWANALVFETLVDGRPWQADVDKESGTDVVYGGQPGARSVVMRASLPGTDIVLESDPVRVDVRCDGGGGGCGVLGRPVERNGLGPLLVTVLGASQLWTRRRRA